MDPKEAHSRPLASGNERDLSCVRARQHRWTRGWLSRQRPISLKLSLPVDNVRPNLAVIARKDLLFAIGL